jgi:dihydropteroate synthase
MSAQDTNFYKKAASIFDVNSPPLVMGILNVTPDSFYDGGRYTSEDRYVIKVKQYIQEGADIIDIGAQSTKPGAKQITEDEELARLIPAIVTIRKLFPEILISADTYRAVIARKAVEAGADIINDISGGTMDEQMFKTIALLKVPYILTHIQGTPQTMQQHPHYENVTNEVMDFFKVRLNQLQQLGVTKIIVDPGFCFGKTLDHNYKLLNELEKFQSLNTPILVGVSRKSMITKLLNVSKEDALNGTTIVNTLALMKGAKILRVHDVKAAKEIVNIVLKCADLQLPD